MNNCIRLTPADGNWHIKFPIRSSHTSWLSSHTSTSFGPWVTSSSAAEAKATKANSNTQNDLILIKGKISMSFIFMTSSSARSACVIYNYRPKRSCRKAMFSQVSVCPQRGDCILKFLCICWAAHCCILCGLKTKMLNLADVKFALDFRDSELHTLGYFNIFSFRFNAKIHILEEKDNVMKD